MFFLPMFKTIHRNFWSKDLKRWSCFKSCMICSWCCVWHLVIFVIQAIQQVQEEIKFLEVQRESKQVIQGKVEEKLSQFKGERLEIRIACSAFITVLRRLLVSSVTGDIVHVYLVDEIMTSREEDFNLDQVWTVNTYPLTV